MKNRTDRQILVVEGETGVAKSIRNKLKRLGYTVPALVFSGAEAIKKAEEMQPDLVLMDIKLPGEMNGIAAAEQIRARFDIPVVYLTNDRGEEAGTTEPFGYVLKPFAARELRNTIEMALYKHKLDKKLKEEAEEALRKDREALARRVEERTAELTRANQELQVEIAERKRVEEALRESEGRYRTLFEQAYDAIFLEDEEDNILDVNRRACELLGYTRAELLTMKIPDLKAPEVRQPEGTTVKQELAQYGGGAPFETIDLHRDGRPIPVEVSINRLTGTREGLVLAIVRDITERKRAEESLQQRNRALELLNRASQVFISTLDLDQVLAIILEEVRRSLDVMACSAWLIDPETNELVCRQVTNPQSEIVRGWRLAPGQGIAGWAVQSGQSSIVPDAPADPRYFKGVDEQTGLKIRSILSVPLQVKETVIGVIQVVDAMIDRFNPVDLKLVEALASTAAIAIENAQLYEETDRLRAFNQTIVQSMREGIILEDETEHITFINPETTARLGYSPEELIGRHWRTIVAPEQIPQVETESAKRRQGIANRYETILLTKAGQRIPVVISVRPLFEAGRFTGVLSVFTDITERVQAEAQIQTSLQEKEVLLKEIHHRVKNNLQIISSLLDLQSDYIQDKQVLDALKDSQNRIRSMALVHTQLYQSKDLGQIDMATYIWNLVSYLNQAYTISLGGITWQIDIDQFFLDIDTAIPCGLIISELVSNCLKHAFPENREGQIRLDFRPDGHFFKLVVSDNGVGLPLELDFPHNKSLGLQLVGMLIHQLDGTIEIDRNGGTTFKITFPRQNTNN